MWHILLGALVLLSPQAAPIPMGPTDAIGFEYEIAELLSAQVVRFERKTNTGNWTDIGIPTTVEAGAPAGWNTYKFLPTAPFDTPTTIYFRACNVSACSVATDPFTFVRVSVPAPAIAAPSNVRRLPGTS